MAGVYVHIPFCKTKCPYCDFYSITNHDKDLHLRFVQAIEKEIELRADYLTNEVETIYFGGGTPSQIDPKLIQSIIDKIRSTFAHSHQLEITIEVNPDDVNEYFIQILSSETEINRISIGTQSFNSYDLKFLGRRHDEKQAIKAIRLLQKYGYENISADLIFAYPHDSLENLKRNLDILLTLNIPHISTYQLTFEPGTKFYRLLKTNKINELDEETTIKLYDFIIDYLSEYGYIHYEISNFAKPNFISRHNFNYWTGEPYLGLGPSAHSYNGNTRSWNIANLHKYLDKIEKGILPNQSEHLSEKDKFNEYILTRLRTYKGINTDFLQENFHEFWTTIKHDIENLIANSYLEQINNHIRLTRKGLHIANSIIAELFVN